jgi:prepilin-type N-terminal cleavage/methylation domain-containing protein
MTSPTSAPIDHRPGRPRGVRRHGGFTLIEMLVVIGIILVLAGILIPAINSMTGRASRAAAVADLQTIATALAEYKKDFGEYPRVRMDPMLANNYITPGTGLTDPQPNPPTGAQILCQALYGPAQAVDPMPVMGKRPRQDGADGFGFRTRPGGKVYPPYLPPDRFKIGIDDETSNVDFNDLRMTIIDRYNRSVLYMPSSPAKPNIRIPGAGTTPYVDGTLANTGSRSEMSYWDADDSLAQTIFYTPPANVINRKLGLKRIRLMLGDANVNGYIDEKEVPIEGSFLLWSAGRDERFGPFFDMATPADGNDPFGASLDYRDAQACDDIIVPFP